ncbi:MAG: T9SS type A sorting domain-containing protein, partial [Flavobacteriaceae bacterium]|nr:T9SS type A sorting domain-containing protein [Flavobacteriaceae bacterium]
VVLFAGSSAGNQDGDISEATFNAPNGIAFSDDETTMYVTDYNSKNLRIIEGISLNVNDFESANTMTLAIYPNPATETIEIKISDKSIQQVEIQLFDGLGKLVYENHTHELSKKIDIASLKKGVYIARITAKEGVYLKKIIK